MIFGPVLVAALDLSQFEGFFIFCRCHEWFLAMNLCLFILIALCFLPHYLHVGCVPACELVLKMNCVEKEETGRRETLYRYAILKKILSLLTQVVF